MSPGVRERVNHGAGNRHGRRDVLRRAGAGAQASGGRLVLERVLGKQNPGIPPLPPGLNMIGPGNFMKILIHKGK
jgi:hypothetical protein